jgi:hypothetical protein
MSANYFSGEVGYDCAANVRCVMHGKELASLYRSKII